jgi:hypothetical protein
MSTNGGPMVAKSLRTIMLVGATALVTVLVQSAVAGVTSKPTEIRGRHIPLVKVVRAAQGSATTSNDWVDLPGATTQFTIPPGERWIALIRFSGDGDCIGAPGWCTLRVLVGGAEAEPATGPDFHWESANDSRQARSVDRSAGPLDPGTYTVQVQWAVGDQSHNQLFSWVLTVEAAGS